MQTAIHQTKRTSRSLLSLTHPNKELFYRQRALLRGVAPAGFPSPANNHLEQRHGLDEQLTLHRESTFFMRVAGESMRELGIFDGDLLAVDRALPAPHKCVVIAVVDGKFTVKQLLHTPNGKMLRAAHPDHDDMPINAEQDFSIWGVVRWNIHKA